MRSETEDSIESEGLQTKGSESKRLSMMDGEDSSDGAFTTVLSAKVTAPPWWAVTEHTLFISFEFFCL